MSCSCTTQRTCGCNLSFKVEGTFLIPYVGGVPLEPVDLSDATAQSFGDTSLALNQGNASLVYTGPDESTDVIPILSIAALISLTDLLDVAIGNSNTGDILAYDGTTQLWSQYTIPEGDIVSSVGIDTDGKIVKSLASDPLPGEEGIPLGGVLLYTGAAADLPTNFLPMDGRTISRATYASYFALVGTTYGPGNNTTTFNIPNMKGRVAAGLDSAQAEFATLGLGGGAKRVTLSTGEMPVHSHGVYDAGHSHQMDAILDNFGGGSSNNALTSFPGANVRIVTKQTGISGTGISIYNAGGGASHENLSPYLTLIYAVRVA